MARLRTLCITTTDGPRDILILDKANADQADNVSQLPPDALQEAGLPPILAFAYEVDLPEDDAPAEGAVDVTTHADSAQGRRVEVSVTGSDPEFTKLIRRMVRMGDPAIMQAVRKAT